MTPHSRPTRQTRRPLPVSCQGGSAPRSAICGSPPATPAGPRPRSPPWPSPLRTSSCAGHLPKDGAIAVPSGARPRFRRAASPNPRALTRFGSARIIRGAQRPRRRSGRCCLGTETRWIENGDTRRGDESSRQLAAGSWQRAGSEGKRGVDWSIRQLVNWGRRMMNSWQQAVGSWKGAHGREHWCCLGRPLQWRPPPFCPPRTPSASASAVPARPALGAQWSGWASEAGFRIPVEACGCPPG
jgi:hypothetical protein